MVGAAAFVVSAPCGNLDAVDVGGGVVSAVAAVMVVIHGFNASLGLLSLGTWGIACTAPTMRAVRAMHNRNLVNESMRG